MRILLLGLPAFKNAFQELGHDVLTCTTDNTGDVWVPEFPLSVDRLWQQFPHGWSPDFVLLTDESTHPLFLGLERLDIPIGWYAIDSHIHHRWHQAYAGVFDMIFVAQRDFVSSYVRDQARQVSQWLPLFCQTVPSLDDSLPRTHNLSFVGSINKALNPARYKFLESLQQAYPIYVATGQYLPIFLQSKMILNQCVDNDVNFRTFEAMACGGLLLMERVGNGLKDLFQDRTHCVMYEKDNIEEIIHHAHYYIAHEKEREEIALRGRADVLQKHTVGHRAQTILETLRSIDCQSVLQQRQARQGEILFLLSPVYEHAAMSYERGKDRFPKSHPMNTRWMALAEKYRHVSQQIHQELGV
ncbi:MAG: glycosyltransferase family protein [Nitrospirales bacterium]